MLMLVLMLMMKFRSVTESDLPDKTPRLGHSGEFGHAAGPAAFTSA
ncbi:hypothetical protein [Micromonospora sp. KC606]|nr:hypothetical protein [Micromonospora sp. KC606]